MKELDDYVFLDRIVTLFRNIVSCGVNNRFYEDLFRNKIFTKITKKVMEISQDSHRHFK